MGRRLDLQTLLKSICDTVYFQPPADVQMVYPCIVYERDKAVTQFAGNNPYVYTKGYQVTVMDRDPDSEIPDKVAMLPKCSFNRFFVANKINHDVFSLFF